MIDDSLCPCREDLFVPHRRGLLRLAGTALVGSGLAAAPARAQGGAQASAGALEYEVAADPTREPGRPIGIDGGYGTRSQFETAARVLAPNPTRLTSWSLTPLASLMGALTPSGLHYERHHSGVPTIDPARHSLVVHGLVETPMRFSMAELRRMPAVTRRHFIECSGNTASEYAGPTAVDVQRSHGLLSTSDWTGVRFRDVAALVGIDPAARWVLAEGADGAVMTRSIPLDKLMDDAILAYGQNGEAIRPEQGYPLRLLLPGYEGNTHIKWLRRMEVARDPFMTREETAKYSDLMANGKAWQFVFAMDVKSVITAPSGGMRLDRLGFHEVSGLAWSGRGKVVRVEVTLDGGRSWVDAGIQGPIEPRCAVRFTLPWKWDGGAAILASRCTDDTGAVQPTRAELVARRGLNAYYHYNGIMAWAVAADGRVDRAVG